MTAPFWGIVLLEQCGRFHGVQVLGESGIICRDGKQVEHEHQTRFEMLLSESGSWSWLMMFGVGPIVLPRIPLGVYYAFTHPSELPV